MAKENMTMDEAYTCPRCGGQAVNVGAMEQIFSDARSEEITCMNCGSSWMVYYKMFDFNKKTLNITDTLIDEDAGVEVTSNDILEDADSSVAEVVADDVINMDCHVVNEDGTKPGIIEET